MSNFVYDRKAEESKVNFIVPMKKQSNIQRKIFNTPYFFFTWRVIQAHVGI